MLSSRPGRRQGFAFDALTELADLQAMAELVLKGEKFQGQVPAGPAGCLTNSNTGFTNQL